MAGSMLGTKRVAARFSNSFCPLNLWKVKALDSSTRYSMSEDYLLIIDDEPGIRAAIKQVLSKPTLEILDANCAEEGIRKFVDFSPLVVLLDIRLGHDSGLELFQQLREIDPRALIVLITGHGTADLAIESMKMGAFDYLVKPLELTQLVSVVDQAVQIGKTMRAPAAVAHSFSVEDISDRIVGNSRETQAVCKSIGRLAPQNVNVLVLGESGTGKELVARAVYHHSRRAESTYLAINCAAIPEELLESELFGHEQGAFTGADRRRIGKFEQCHGGTIFLDEIGDMPLPTQAKILRLLQEGEFQRVGGNQTYRCDVRVISATHQDLEQMIDQKKFRRDLFYRLRGATITLPPLRNRLDDISELAHYFLFRFNAQLGTNLETISEAAIEKLRSYNWPGNIRELQSVIREAMIVSTGPTLMPEFLPADFSRSREPDLDGTVQSLDRSGPEAWRGVGPEIERLLSSQSKEVYRIALNTFDRVLLGRIMTIVDGNQGKATEILGISRPTLRAKLRSIFSSSRDDLGS
jgi:two-component system nitrogen regulation response regulator GlnG